MVICLIAIRSRPVVVDVIVYATVLITVLSGADYFFGLRRRLAELAAEKRAAARTPAGASVPASGGGEPGLE
jgi:hypothetical protein